MPCVNLGYVRDTAMQESAVPGQAERADGSKPFAGFITRDSQATGAVLGNIIYPGRLGLRMLSTGVDCQTAKIGTQNRPGRCLSLGTP